MSTYKLTDPDGTLLYSGPTEPYYEADLKGWVVLANLYPDPDRLLKLGGRLTMVSVARFKAMFSLESQFKVKIARGYVPVDLANPDQAKVYDKAGLDALYEMLDDLKAEQSKLDLEDPKVQESLDWMAIQGFITQDEASEIKLGYEI